MTDANARIAVLLSGRGSNYVAIQEAVLRGEVPATVELVLSDVEAAPGLERAREYGVPTVVVRPSNAYGPHDKFDFATSHVKRAGERNSTHGSRRSFMSPSIDSYVYCVTRSFVVLKAPRENKRDSASRLRGSARR